MESKTIYKILNLGSLEYYVTHLHIINGVLPVRLTSKEIEVVAAFLEEGNIFDARARRNVREKLGGLSYASLGNYLKNLKDKGVIIEVGERLKIIEVLVPSGKEQRYNFTIRINENEDRK